MARLPSLGGRILLALVVLLAEFAVLEGALRWYGGSEAGTEFRSLLMPDPRIGFRLRPDTRIRFDTPEFSTDIAINRQGVRDDADIGPKPAGERRVLLLGDSLVLSVQVPFAETFGERLESRLNAGSPEPTWRVINGGVQGYGPVEEWLFYKEVASRFEPDIVLLVLFVCNDAIEAADMAAKLTAVPGAAVDVQDTATTQARRIVRSSLVLQNVRLRVQQVRSRFATPAPERPLSTYLADAPPFVARGLDVTRQVVRSIDEVATRSGARVGVVLMPARFQTDDADYGRLAESTRRAGGQLVRHAATERFRDALAPSGVPTFDLLPRLAAEERRIELFFQGNVHLTRRGHDVVSRALFEFLTSAGLTDPSAP